MNYQYLYLRLAQAPFPAADSVGGQATTEVSEQGAQNAATSLEGARNAATTAVSQLDGLWELYTTPTGVYWITLVKAISPLLILGFFFWAFTAVYKWNTSGKSHFPWEMLLPVVAVIFLFANNGFLLSGIVQASRYLPQTVNKTILDTAVQGVTGRQRIQQVNAKNAYNNVLKEKLSQCTSTVNKKDCEDNAKKEAEAQAKLANRSGNLIPKGKPSITDYLALPLTIPMEGIKMGMVGAIIGILTTLAYGSHLFFGLIQVLWASLAPIFTALHLIPNAPNLKIYFSGFIGISLAIIFNSAFQVGTSMLLATAADWDPLLLPLLNGLLGVVFSGFIAYLGITGVYATIGTVGGGIAKMIKK